MSVWFFKDNSAIVWPVVFIALMSCYPRVMCLFLCPSLCPTWTGQSVRWWWEEPVDIWAAVVEIVETIGWHGSKYKVGAALTAERTYMWTDRSFNHFHSACTTVTVCLSHTTVKNKINYLHHMPNEWIQLRLVFGQVTVQDAYFSSHGVPASFEAGWFGFVVVQKVCLPGGECATQCQSLFVQVFTLAVWPCSVHDRLFFSPFCVLRLRKLI